ncbi:hypothetical protein LTS18_000400 [Coniosporium uncinatum]|uniref:Uncharacterized protein n=1 Tax=Coniosporium uncinatum TaxID=93489 RepID=A0ACC3DBS3_9PEZI|nr:hypothetical protein LTS18_000400 [Coniosporium uncinatum]
MASARKIIGLLNIGQSQAEPDYDFSRLGGDIIVESLCPLDAYSVSQLLEDYKPRGDELPISSSTSSGERILLSQSALASELQNGIREAEERDFDAVVITCTGNFRLDANSLEIILPGQVLRQQAEKHRRRIRKAAVLVPVDEQQKLLRNRWLERLPSGVEVQAFTMAPGSSLGDCHKLGLSLQGMGIDCIIMDCFGYSLAQSKTLKASVNLVLNAKEATIQAIQSRS